MKKRGVVLQIVMAGCVLLLLNGLCGAETWNMYLDGEKQKYYYDPSSLERPAKRIVRVWERITEKNKEGVETEKARNLLEINCSSNKFRIIAYKELDPATNAEGPEVRTEGEPWTVFSLDSILGILYDNVCWEKTPDGKIQKPN